MRRADILPYLNLYHSHWFRKVAKFGPSKLEKVCLNETGFANEHQPDVGEFSRYLSGSEVPRISELFENPFWYNSVARRLGYPSLFEASSFADVDSIADSSTSPLISEKSASIAASTTNALDRTNLHPMERQAVDLLAAALLKPGRASFIWNAPYSAGRSFIADNLSTHPEITANYESILLVRPSIIHTHPFRREMIALMDRFNIADDPIRFPDRLHLQLQKTQTLLILLHGDALPVGNTGQMKEGLDSTVMAYRLLRATPENVQTEHGANVLCVGIPEGTSEKFSSFDKDEADTITEALTVPSGQRQRIFQEEFQRFCAFRQRETPERTGPRIKRASHHYESIEERTVWPINIRLRAFFASNLDNHAYSDPTAGFKRLAGTSTLPPDIKSFKEDIEYHIRVLRYRYTRSQLYLTALQHCSTALYWLSSDAMCLLESRKPIEAFLADPPGERPKKHDLITERPELRSSISTIEMPRANGATRYSYAVSISVKSIIQDNWRETSDQSRLARALAHYKIARRLFHLQNEKNFLQTEFPFNPHWGRSRMYFLSECIRHLIRTCEAAPEEHFYNGWDRPFDSFPDDPIELHQGCDPSQVLDYCYGHLYRVELDGNRIDQEARFLSKRHGAYALSVELLQLMSQDGRVGEPHPALHPSLRRWFIKDCGYALLNIGDLDGAQRCFASLVEGKVGKRDLLGQAADQIRLAFLKGVRFELESARKHLAEARRKVRECEETENFESHRMTTIQRNIIAEHIHLLHLEDKLEEARAEMEKLQTRLTPTAPGEVPQQVADIDLLHYQIAILRRSGNEADFDSALDLCLTAIFNALSDGRHHDAMGFKISLSQLLRKAGRARASDTALTSLHRDIILYGSSERTYLAFLLEAARVLKARDNPLRAYASYLHEAVQRAKSKGFLREAMLAEKLAVEQLHAIKTKKAAMSPEDWGRLIDNAKGRDAEYRREIEDVPRARDEFPIDPINSYASAEAVEVLEIMRSDDGLDELLRGLQS
jgi:hypothetical protein